MYNNPYMPNAYNPQITVDKINAQMNELEKIKQQLQQPVQQPTNLTQNFQLAPSNKDVIKYANSLEEVQRDMVIGDTPYFSKDMSVVWVKNTKGDIKTYELTEIIPKDEKDIQIELLQAQIDELKKGINKDEPIITNDNESENSTNSNGSNEPIRNTIKKNESSSISRVPTSKRK